MTKPSFPWNPTYLQSPGRSVHQQHISQVPHRRGLSCMAHGTGHLPETENRGFLWTFISYFIIPLVIHTGMHDEYIHTSLVEKPYWALSILYFSKTQKVGQIKPNFHWNSPKSFPMKAIIPAKYQFSTCSCRAIQILIFKCFHKGQIYSFFSFCVYKHLINISWSMKKGRLSQATF